MLGLIPRSFQFFLRDTYGVPQRELVAKRAEFSVIGFESMLSYHAAQMNLMIEAASSVLNRPRESLLEDMGTDLVSRETLGTLRRLLRFSGVDFSDF